MKKEWVYRELLCDHAQARSTQVALANACGISLGHVHNALEPLVQMGAIQKQSRGFRLADPKKALLYWASIRNLQKDIVYQTRVELPVAELERTLPPVLFTAYSGCKSVLTAVPAEYSEVWVSAERPAIEQRFPKKPGPPNLFVLRPDPHLLRRGMAAAQLFVDLWNLDTWYAKEFLTSLEAKLPW